MKNKIAEEILDKYDLDFDSENNREYYTEQIIKAMEEYASIKIAEKDKEIDRLKSINHKKITSDIETSMLHQIINLESELKEAVELLKQCESEIDSIDWASELSGKIEAFLTKHKSKE